MRTAIIALGIVALATPAFAHPGGLNAEGCHNDRRNGGYHCHRGPSRGSGGNSGSSSRSTPAFVGAGAGTGTSTRYYANCSQAHAAGVTPIRRGQPGYGRHLDRDGDGIACEI